MKRTSRRIVSICMAIVLFTTILNVTELHKVSAKSYAGGYITLNSISKSSNKITVKYTVTKNAPNGANVSVGMEYPASYRTSGTSVSANKKGTYTKTFTVAGGYARIYAKLQARDYTDKSVLGTYSNMKTGTFYHTVSSSEENLATGITIAVGLGLTFMSPATKAGARVLQLVSAGWTVSSAFMYAPREGDYVVTTTSFNESTGKYVAKVKIYKSQSSYKAGDAPANTYTESYTIPKF